MEVSMSTKRYRHSKPASHPNTIQKWKIFTPAPIDVLLKTAILLADLIVASIAMIYQVHDAVVWSFLTMIAGYAAFSKKIE
jgi:hypothetical protein